MSRHTQDPYGTHYVFLSLHPGETDILLNATVQWIARRKTDVARYRAQDIRPESLVQRLRAHGAKDGHAPLRVRRAHLAMFCDILDDTLAHTTRIKVVRVIEDINRKLRRPVEPTVRLSVKDAQLVRRALRTVVCDPDMGNAYRQLLDGLNEQLDGPSHENPNPTTDSDLVY